MMKHVTLAALVGILLSSCGSSTDTFTVRGSGSATETLSALATRAVAVTAGSPTSVKVSLLALYLSTNADCSSPELVEDFGTAVEKDMFENPVLFSGSPADGNYNCLILKIEDVLKVTPDAEAAAEWPGVCVEGTEFSFDIYRTDSDPGFPWVDLDGNPVTANGSDTVPVADAVYVFASTDPAAAAASALAPSPNQIIQLSSPMIVPGQVTVYTDYTNGLTGETICKVESGFMGFR